MKIFEILQGLPGIQPYPVQFTNNKKSTHSEGFVVKFFPSNKEAWIGNFQRGLSHYSHVFEYPGRENLLMVIAGGDVYVVDINQKHVVDVFSAGITSVFLVPIKNLMILIEYDGLISFGTEGIIWRYDIRNCDGIRKLSYSNNVLEGEFCQVPEDNWYKFQIDINSGKLIEKSIGTH